MKASFKTPQLSRDQRADPTPRELYVLMIEDQCGPLHDGDTFTHRAHFHDHAIYHRFNRINQSDATERVRDWLRDTINLDYDRDGQWGDGWNNSVPMYCQCVRIVGREAVPITREEALSALPTRLITEAEAEARIDAEGW